MSLEELLARSHRFDEGSKQWVSKRSQDFAEVLNDIWPNLSLAWIPPDSRTQGDIFPFAIVERTRDGQEHIVMYLQEEELGEQTLARLFDMGQTDPMTRIRNMEAAKELMKLKEQMERMEEDHEKAKFLWRTPYHTVRMNGKKLEL